MKSPLTIPKSDRYRVPATKGEPHVVDIFEDGRCSCTCQDFCYTDDPTYKCKHIGNILLERKAHDIHNQNRTD
jgi:hypothetical protein